MARSPSVNDDRVLSSTPGVLFATPGVTGPLLPPPPGVLGNGVSPSSPVPPPFRDRLRFFWRPGVSPPPNGVVTVLLRASLAASVRAAGVSDAAAAAEAAPAVGVPTVRDRAFPGVLPPTEVNPVPGVRRPVPGVPGVKGVAGVGVRVPRPSGAPGPSFARLRRVSTASRRCASLSRAGRSFISNCWPPLLPLIAPTMLSISMGPARELVGTGVARGSRIMGVPSMEPHVICGESPSIPCRSNGHAKAGTKMWDIHERQAYARR